MCTQCPGVVTTANQRKSWSRPTKQQPRLEGPEVDLVTANIDHQSILDISSSERQQSNKCLLSSRFCDTRSSYKCFAQLDAKQQVIKIWKHWTIEGIKRNLQPHFAMMTMRSGRVCCSFTCFDWKNIWDQTVSNQKRVCILQLQQKFRGKKK